MYQLSINVIMKEGTYVTALVEARVLATDTELIEAC
jgi:hypothetical protein